MVTDTLGPKIVQGAHELTDMMTRQLDHWQQLHTLLQASLSERNQLMQTVARQEAQLEKLATSAFCRRRLAVVLVRLKMAETLREAVTFVEQGHVRVGPETVSDPAFHVTRSMEDFVTWVDTSKIKRKVMKYKDALDDYDLLNA